MTLNIHQKFSWTITKIIFIYFVHRHLSFLEAIDPQLKQLSKDWRWQKEEFYSSSRLFPEALKDNDAKGSGLMKHKPDALCVES